MKRFINSFVLFILICVMLIPFAGCSSDTSPAATHLPDTSAASSGSAPVEPNILKELSADEAIESVTAIGFVDIDGAKLNAIAVKYSVDLSGADISADMFEIEVGSIKAPENYGDGEVGDIINVYINDKPEVSANGGSDSGNYVIIEVYTDYLCGSELLFTNSLSCGVIQTGTIESECAVIYKGSTLITNYTHSGKGQSGKVLNADSFIIPDIANFQWFTDHPGTYGADGPSFVAHDCFDEKTGETQECHLGYALCLPDDWHEDGSYAMVVLDNPAARESTHPLSSVLETRSPAVYASEWAQNLVKEKHGLDGLIVIVPVVTARVDDNGCSPAEYEALVQLWDYIQETYSVDKDHVYGSGQSVGGMVLLETNRNRDNYFAALMLYEDQWCQNYYKDTLFARNQAADEKTAATAPMHYPRVKEYLTWDYYLDTQGNPVYEGHDPNNFYYLISDDNILIMNRKGNNLSNDTWRELAYLYQDLTGTTITQHIVPSKLSLEERDADIAAYLAAEAPLGIKWVSFEIGNNGYTCRQVMAGYEWLLSQDRQSEISREKLDINKPFELASQQILNESRQLHYTDAEGNPIYFLTGKEGSGTQFYNTCWLNMEKVADAKPGWLPEGMSWSKGVSAATIEGVTAINDEGGRLIAVAIKYDSDMRGLVANLKGDDIIGLDGTVRQDIKIVLNPFEFYANSSLLDCEISNIYVNSVPEVRENADRCSGSGCYVIVELNTSSNANELSVRQITTLRTDTLIASPSWEIH